MKRYIPNIITVGRLILAPLLLGLTLLTAITPLNHLLFFLAILALAVSDKLDGWLARRWQCTSAFGAKWDPIADKLTVLLFIPLILLQMIHFIPVILIILRDLLSSSLRLLLNRAVPARISGQIKTAVNLVCLCVLFAALPVKNGFIPLLSNFSEPLYWICGSLISLVCIWSGWDYLCALWLKNSE